MSPLTLLLGAYALIGFLYWTLMAVAALKVRRDVPVLADLHPPEPRQWPKLSVVIPACNEAEEIQDAVSTLMEEDYPDLEIILVDDRSTDATGAIMDRLTAADPRVKGLHLRDLPEGWLGKVNALRQGYALAGGAYVLFTDADVHFQSGTLRKAVAYCEKEGIDHLTAFPEIWPSSLPLELTIAPFIRQFVAMTRPWAVSDPRSKAFLGIGAFNLVRRSAFERTPGFEWLRMEVADDVCLGLMMKRAGARCAVVTAFGQVGLYFYRSFGQAVRGAQKGFAAAGYRLPRALLIAALSLALETAPVVALLILCLGGPAFLRWSCAAVLAAFAASAYLLDRWTRVARRHGPDPMARPALRAGRLVASLLTPLVAPLTVGIFVHAAVAGRLRGGVVWRGTLYRIEDLRRGARLPVL